MTQVSINSFNDTINAKLPALQLNQYTVHKNINIHTLHKSINLLLKGYIVPKVTKIYDIS